MANQIIKVATTIEQQLDLLKHRGMNIGDEDKAKENLLDISYAILLIYMLGRISTNRVLELDEKLDKLLQNNKVPENVKTIIEQSSGLNIPK